MGERRKQRIVLLPLPLQGHINPMLRLGSILHANGFSITVAHSDFNTPNAPNPSSHPHFSFLPLPDAVDFSLLRHSGLSFLHFLSNLNTKLMAQLLRHLPQQIDAEEMACLIYDSMFYDAEATASQLRIPSLVLRICSATFSLVQTQLPELISHGRLPNPDVDGAGEQIIPELQPLRLKDLQIFRNPNLTEGLELYHQMSNITTTKAIIFDTVECLERFSIQQIALNYVGVPIFTPGPFHKLAPVGSGNSNLWKEDTDCLKWLDKQTPESVLYVSIGSAMAIDVNELVEMAHALADCEQPFLWVVRPGSVRGGSPDLKEHFPEKFKKLVAEETGCVVEWCPQIQVLSHAAVGGFMTQCGWNSIQEAICEGVPMICRPGWEDQVMTARYICHEWRIGLEIKGKSPSSLQRGDMEEAIRTLMASEEGKKMRKRVADLRSKVEIAIGEGGSSSMAVHALVDFISSLPSA